MQIVDWLEAVKIEAQDRNRGAATFRPRQHLAQAVTKKTTVGQRGERVVMRQMLDAFGRSLAFTDVAHGNHAGATVFERHGAGVDFNRD